MKINFTKKEYRLLLDLVYLGEWMIEAHETGRTPESEKYEMIIQKIYSHAKEMGCEDLIESAEQFNEYFPTMEYEESEVRDYIDEYNDETFWSELIGRLMERDVRQECADKNIDVNSIEDFWELGTPHEEKYAQEFSNYGLARLVVKEA